VMQIGDHLIRYIVISIDTAAKGLHLYLHFWLLAFGD